jgi:orotate phosphoribosyltransferase
VFQSGEIEVAVSNLRQEFVRFAIEAGVLRFGEFTTKAGRLSPYFFNAGAFSSGAALGRLARFYALTLADAERRNAIRCDMLFGPAYKGITLASATAVAFSQLGAETGGRDLPFAFNRKEAKDHGERGVLVGSMLAGHVVIVDDVISAGTSVRESVEIIRGAGATPAGVLIALDRMELGSERAGERPRLSAVDEVMQEYALPVIAIADLDDVMEFLGTADASEMKRHAPAITAYRERYGTAAARPLPREASIG